MAPTGKSRIVQLHPTRLCNLRCLHCYSSSGPEERGALDVALLCDFLTDAAREDYTVLAVSGGEPLLYGDLSALLLHAHNCGLQTTFTTNGMLLSEAKINRLIGLVDLIAISLDGVPQSHNRMRASAHAFERMSSQLTHLRASGIPFGFIFTLTQYNLDELEWVAQFALEQGARLLQIHPLEAAGRAETTLLEERPDEFEASFAFLESTRIATALQGKMRVQLDLVDRRSLPANSARFYADPLPEPTDDQRLAEFISPLIVETDGSVVPLFYGFPRMYGLGNLHQAPLRELAVHWRRHMLQPFRTLCRSVYEQADGATRMSHFNWYEAVAREAHTMFVER
jgi:Fe-coproporphyrin III synthase